MEDASKKKAVLYLRYSSNAQTEQSIEGQRHACQRFAEQNGYTIVGEYIDRATSASHDTKKRTQFLRMIEDAKKPIFDFVIVYKLDRFARNRYDSATYKHKLSQAGVKLLSATEGLSDRPESVLLESMLEGYAEFYSKELAQKVNRGIEESIAKRHYLGGPVPFGFVVVDKKLQPDPNTAPQARRLFEMVLEGKTYTQILRWMADQGIRSARGKKFQKNSLYKILHSKRYIGYYCYRDLELPGACDPIVDEKTFLEVQRRLKMTEKRHHDNTQYLLSGKLFCGHCGSQMNGEKGRGKGGKYYHYYTCLKKKRRQGCQKKPIRKEVIEDLVAEKAAQMLDDEMLDSISRLVLEEVRKSESENPAEELKAEVRELTRQIENGVNAILAGHFSSALDSRIKDLEEQKAALEARIEELEADRIPLTAEMIKDFLFSIRDGSVDSEDARKYLIDAFVRKVTLWDTGDGNNRKLMIEFNISGIQPVECSTSVLSGPPLRTDTNTLTINLEAMVIVKVYDLSF